MSVLIKGMDMPKNCQDCSFEQEGFWCGALMQYEDTKKYKSKRHPKCPLVPVPPHGRLGDLDLIIKVFKTSAKNPFNQEAVPYSWAFAYECLADVVGDMPTIIPAESEGE